MSDFVTVTGLAVTSSMLAQIQDITGGDPELLDSMALVTINRVRARFLDAKDAGGTMWPVSDGAILRASPMGQTVGGKTYLDGMTLFMSGKLFHSIQVRKTDTGKGRSIYTNIIYASAHNKGTNKMPKRTFLEWGADDVAIILRMVSQRLSEVQA